MTPPHVKTESAARVQARAVIRLQRAFAPERHPDWKEARAAILAGAPVDTLIPSLEGVTTLILAARHNQIDEAEWLLNHGADPNAVDASGWTIWWHMALHYPPNSEYRVMIAMLLDHGADPAVITPDRRTAPEIFSRGPGWVNAQLDDGLTRPACAAVRRRLLDKLTAAQRAQWLPKSSVAEAAMETAKLWHRTP